MNLVKGGNLHSQKKGKKHHGNNQRHNVEKVVYISWGGWTRQKEEVLREKKNSGGLEKGGLRGRWGPQNSRDGEEQQTVQRHNVTGRKSGLHINSPRGTACREGTGESPGEPDTRAKNEQELCVRNTGGRDVKTEMEREPGKNILVGGSARTSRSCGGEATENWDGKINLQVLKNHLNFAGKKGQGEHGGANRGTSNL